MKFAISSCWNSSRHEDGYSMMVELAEQGFSYVELSHGTRISLVPGILKAIEDGVIRVASVHNFCPLPVGVMGAAPNLFEPCSRNRREREMWLQHTRKTVEFAARVDCQRIVLHSGSIHFMFRHPERAIDAARDNPDADGSESPALIKARESGLKRMRKAREAYMKRLLDQYREIAPFGKEHGVKFGIENREGFTELPLEEDLADFLESLKELEVFGYWHDSGHAQLKQDMGLIQHRTFLQEMRPYLLGFHLHDVSNKGRDHRAPGDGVMDWSVIADLVHPDDLVIMELSPSLKPEQIREGRDFLKRSIPAIGAI
jgi:sugar phosphate isomerase/epimerase